ncbi:MAG: hypothetical protein M0R80_17595 [Proteobacteria bacterium]|jgi:hypothetical protein|nr:hypothetical protein [Pseudomonadota bacterium]
MTQKEKIIKLLSDGEWHNATELHRICWRYSARMWDLKRDGYEFEKRINPINKLEDWKLTNNLENAGTPLKQFYNKIQKAIGSKERI